MLKWFSYEFMLLDKIKIFFICSWTVVNKEYMHMYIKDLLIWRLKNVI
jgi:hypothetical protein